MKHAPLSHTLRYRFKDPELLTAALTHPSALKGSQAKAFQRLEFLGDRALGLSIAHLLYTQFPHLPEGDLAKRLAHLCSKSQLVKIAHLWEISQYLIAPGLQAGADNVLADCVEAALGAVYLDGGLSPVVEIIAHFWETDLLKEDSRQDAKTQLQLFLQAKGLDTPVYHLVDTQGPAHAPSFIVEVGAQGLVASARAATKKEAEKLAAAQLLKQLESKA